MSYYSPSIEKLIESFAKLPSIGNKTATRLAFYMLNATDEETENFINNTEIKRLKGIVNNQKIKKCQ